MSRQLPVVRKPPSSLQGLLAADDFTVAAALSETTSRGRVRSGLRSPLLYRFRQRRRLRSFLRDAADVLRVDLKADSEAAYKRLGGRLQPVLDTIQLARELGYWVEVVTLVVPGLNQERRAIAHVGDILRELSPAPRRYPASGIDGAASG